MFFSTFASCTYRLVSSYYILFNILRNLDFLVLYFRHTDLEFGEMYDEMRCRSDISVTNHNKMSVYLLLIFSFLTKYLLTQV